MKMKKLCGIFAAAATMFCCAAGLGGLTASAARPFTDNIANCCVYDVHGVLSDEQEADLNAQIRAKSDELDMYVAVVIYGPETEFYSDYAVECQADNDYDMLFNPMADVDTDGVLLLINNSTMYDYLSTSGMGQLYYYNGENDNRAYSITNGLGSYLKNEQYVEAVEHFLSDLTYYYEKGVPKNAFTYNESNGLYYYEKDGELVSDTTLPVGFGKNLGLIAAIAGLLGLGSGGISYGVIGKNYNKKLIPSPTSYVSSKDTAFAVKDDIFLKENTTRHEIARDTGGGGGGGGHSGGGSSHVSSGGHSHSGGGSHR